MKLLRNTLIVGLMLSMVGCGGGGGGAVPAKSGVAVTVSGLAGGTELTLWNNDKQALTVTSNGSFTAAVLPRASYSMSLVDQPDGQYCTVINGTGTENGSNPTVTVNCSAVSQGISSTTEVTTFAGSGLVGYVDGDGASARFWRPSGVAVDSAGNVYVADAYNNVIRKIVPSGEVSTLAGSGLEGRADGDGAAASFNQPKGITVDGADNVYVADTGNNLIRKISPAGTVTTVAGTGFPGSADGPATAATFCAPADLKFDAAGNLYIADSGYGNIRKVSPGGVVSTIAAGINYPTGLAVDSNANVYVASWNWDVIQKINPASSLAHPLISTFAGSGLPGNSNGLRQQASFYSPFYLAVDKDDNIYVSEASNPLSTTVNMKIRVITPSGMVSDYAGAGAAGSANGDGTVATFSDPAGIAFDVNGNLYVADSSNNLIRKIRRVN